MNKKGYELWICGDGGQKQTLEQQTKLYGLTTSVKFLGNRDDIDILLRGAYCNVLSSRFEGKPVSLIESKVVGCPNI
ncbi:glycosyltransferase, partial [Escherichia coli]|nr:glycosyltransferase [Escherichia coli]